MATSGKKRLMPSNAHLQIVGLDRAADSPQRHQNKRRWVCRPDVFRSAFFSPLPSFHRPGVLLQPSEIAAKARVLAKWHRSSPPHSQQRGGLHPKHRYSAPVAAHGSACTSRYPRQMAVSYRQDRRCLYTPRTYRSPVHMACSGRLRHGAASSKAGWPKHSAVQRSSCCKCATSMYSTCSTLASARSPAPASTLTPTPRVRHAAQAVQLESYLDYGASRSAEVGVRPSSWRLEDRLRQALVQAPVHALAQYKVATATARLRVAGTQRRPERRQPRRSLCALASVPAALSVLTVGRPKGPWPKYALRLEYDAAPNRMSYLQGCAPPVL
ncbi:hypothetical protein TRIATDRAFT_286253 [Trichoderma atroviride IMI 206040]|uniref:Uncharacterized protein n=1 Tax=Hypocrea atroviridis (strain ATCC 20476 / IMI 206040) TaxID=452589 RepID=G9P6I0_HYPAI|nr:uncharacterized protein TRIATDRAFT_286253 [Trichoderma atroviride IMI 206040]EHK40623.1 hypothetical protein TRIATDRAFT_286253 [Trichoderma atroviride IMI 206040]